MTRKGGFVMNGWMCVEKGCAQHLLSHLLHSSSINQHSFGVGGAGSGVSWHIHGTHVLSTHVFVAVVAMVDGCIGARVCPQSSMCACSAGAGWCLSVSVYTHTYAHVLQCCRCCCCCLASTDKYIHAFFSLLSLLSLPSLLCPYQ